MTNRTRAQAARERTVDRRSTEEKADELAYLREKRARQKALAVAQELVDWSQKAKCNATTGSQDERSAWDGFAKGLDALATKLTSLSSAPAQEDGSKDLGWHPRGSGQNLRGHGHE